MSMEDDWYSGDIGDGSREYSGSVMGGSANLTGGGSGVGTGGIAGGFGDSFTPPNSHAGMETKGVRNGMAFVNGYGGMAGGVGGALGGGAVGGRLGDDGEEDYTNEPPLLEELEINFEHIWSKTLAVILPTKSIDISYLDDTDLAGPLVFCLCLGVCLLFMGKVYFGYIYGFGAFGCLATTGVLNLMGDKGIDMWKTGSILGYSMLPVVGLAAVSIVVDMTGLFGLGLGATAVLWCTLAATRLFEQYLGMRQQRYLVAYPVGLLYCCFVLITIY
ncbi:unnamed protein product [Discosporangium mesarthrocarpum]